MKTICILQDAEGNLCVQFTTNGDLIRRELAKTTGAAWLIWSSVAPTGTAPAELIARLEHDILPRFAGHFSRGHAPAGFYLVVAWAMILIPLLHHMHMRFRRRLRRLVRAFRPRVLLGRPQS